MEDGIKTFPFPVKLDDRIKMIELEFGIQGYAVVWKLHQAIYSVGYYLKWDIDTQLLFINDYRLSMVGRNLVSEIVASCLRRGVFESSLYEKYQILTSERIQETFLTAKERNKKVIVNKDYALPIVYTFIENANKKGKNVNIFWKNADICEQKKEKEKKGNNIHSNACENDFDLLEYEKLLQIVKEECQTIFNRHQAKVDKGNLQIVRDIMQILEQLQGQYSYEQLREVFRKANKIFCVKPSYSSCDIKWVLNNIQRVLSEEDCGTDSSKKTAPPDKGFWDDVLDKLGRID